jgi:hypothetical protein
MSAAVVPYRPVLNLPVYRRRTLLGSLGAGSAVSPIGQGSGAGAATGAEEGASVGSIIPGVGTAIGAVVGAAVGAIAGSIDKTDPENVDFNDAVAIWQQNPNAIYSLGNPYLALAGLFDLNITTNIPIYKKFGHMGEAAFVVWLTNTVYQAAQAGKITANDTALTIMANIVQPAINAWGYGAMSDPHADLINRLIVTMILQYTAGEQGNWYAVGGQYPMQFNSIPPFKLPQAVAPAQSAAAASTSATPPSTSMTNPQCYVAGSSAATMSSLPQAPAVPTNVLSTDGSQVTAPGTALRTATGTLIYLGPQAAGDPDNPYGYPTWESGQHNGYSTALVMANGGIIYSTNAVGSWYQWEGNWVQLPSKPTLSTSPTSYTPGSSAATMSSLPIAPQTPTVVESTDGTEVTAPGTALETSAGTLIYLGPQAAGDPDNPYGYPIWENGTHNGYAVGLLMANGGQIYSVNATGTWYQWTVNNWVQMAAPPSVGSATPTPTTSTVASPQSGVSTTASTTSTAAATTTGNPVATTASGDTVTDTDIQDLIEQMAQQGATSQQTYAAVLQALQDSGANVNTALQSQVASQVQASVPVTSSSGSGSDLGLYIVGGGLALLALVFFMGRRAPA